MLELVNLKKTYKTKAGDTVALNGVNLKFADKGMVFITGKSGCGKTTLLNMIGGLDNLDSGDIIVDGKKFSEFTLSDYDNYRNTLVGFVFQEYNLLPEFNIGKNINIANELQGKKPEEHQVEDLLDTVEIGGYEHRKPAQLSGGQKQRVAIARALIKNPKIVLADEPTGALDSATGIQVMDILKELSKDKLIIVVSHEMEFAEKYADRIIRIVDGQVVEDITLSNVEVKDSVYDLGQEVVVKTGVKLNKDEADKVISAIENNKKISVTDKITVRERKATKEVEGKMPDKPISFIKSKMKFKSIFALGVKSLFSKPVRLVFTVLLSVIAFAVFGLFDAVASYNSQQALANLLDTAEYKAVSVSAMVDDSKYNQAEFKISQNYINSLNSKTGYSFRGVYDINDKEEVVNDKRTYINKSYGIKELYSGKNNNIAIEELYYYRDLSGIVEFKESEIKNNVILKNSYNYKILPYANAHYPTLNTGSGSQEVAISLYMAKSIAYWMEHNGLTSFGGKEFDGENLGSLIGAKLDFNYLYTTDFVISAIIDCGAVPAKYEKLKERDAYEYLNLQYDFDTYLNSGCNLMLFLPEGYVNLAREKNDRVVSYYADYKNTNYMFNTVSINKEHDIEVKAGSIFYNVNDFTAENTIMFSDIDNESKAKPVLQKNEVLVNIYNVEALFYAEKQEARNQVLSSTISKFDNMKTALINGATLQAKKTAVKGFADVMKEVYPGYTDAQILSLIFNKEIVIRQYHNAKTSPTLEKTYKVVGFYFDADTNLYSTETRLKYYPLVMSETGLKNVGINTNQGIYSRAVAPLVGTNGNADLLSEMMNKESGFMLSWYKNGIIEILDENAVFIGQFVDLFLYASIVIILFSVFMLMNYITASIASKRQTIGILRALGTNGTSILLMFLIESAIIALINGILACVVGYVASIFVNAYILVVMSLTVSFAMFGFRQILLILLASLVAGFVSSIMPIVKIVKEKPVALIRKE